MNFPTIDCIRVNGLKIFSARYCVDLLFYSLPRSLTIEFTPMEMRLEGFRGVFNEGRWGRVKVLFIKHFSILSF